MGNEPVKIEEKRAEIGSNTTKRGSDDLEFVDQAEGSQDFRRVATVAEDEKMNSLL